jgi:hypothetical protein
LGPREVVFVNGFLDSSSLCALKISASSVELGSRDDFWVGSDAFFVNCFCVNSSSCPLKISSSGVELGFEDYFREAGTQFSSMVSQSAVVYVRRRCQHQAQ